MRIHSLTTRILLTLLLSTALPFLAFGWYARAEMEERLESQVVRVFLPERARSTAEKVANRLAEISDTTKTVANMMRAALSSGDVRDFDQLVDHTPGPDADLMLLVDSDGTVLRHLLHPRLDRRTRMARRALLPENVADTAWFSRISEGDGLVWGDRHLSPFLHKSTQRTTHDPADYSLSLACSVPTASGAFAAVYAEVTWNRVQHVLDETARFLKEEAGFASAEVFLCNASGDYLAHSERSQYVGGRLNDTLAAMLPRPGAPVETAFVGRGGEERRAGLAAVDFQPFKWWVGLHARADELLETSRDLSNVLLLVTAVTALVLVAWSIVASLAILRPVRRLVTATQQIARGDLSARVRAKGRHELADLGRAFNQMAADLDERTQQLKKVERQAAWAEMARQVAHEIKNPLTPMRMSAQLLQRARNDGDPRLPELVDRLARTVIDQTDALSRIASDFRQFAGPPQRQLERVEADRLLDEVRDVFAPTAESSGTGIRFMPGCNGSQIEVDRQELRRVFLNLIQNALAACNGRGSVEVTSEQAGGHVVFRVQDDGPGIDPEVRRKLFDPYFTTKSSGTGLGLAICRRIVEAHRGRIVLESSEPGRTVFRVEIPVA